MLHWDRSNISADNFIGGKFKQTSVNQDVRSPYQNEIIGSVSISSAADVEEAVESAFRAAQDWKLVPIKERCNHLFKIRELLLSHIEDLGHVAAAESGKTPAEAKAGVLKGVEVIEYALSLQNSDAGGALDVSRGVRCEYLRQPLGVVAGIVPFNFPAMVPLWMYPIAIAIGNTFVLKPSEKVPLTSRLIADLIGQSDIPPGVFNTINGDAAVAKALIEHPKVRGIGFVGSTQVAAQVYKSGTALGKRVLALGGAKNHSIIAPDADTNLAVEGITNSFAGCAGQRCMALSVAVAIAGTDHIIDGIVKRAGKIKLGTEMGAIIDAPALEKINRYLNEAEAQGCRIILDGRKTEQPNDAGFWIGPTIIDGATPTMPCAQDEIFGPVLTVVRTKTLKEAIEVANNSIYGNATSVFTSSGAVARQVGEQCTAGMIGINIGVPVPREPFSFGGTKASKFGHGDITGDGVLDFWTDKKKITTKWSGQNDTNWMS